jgi:hypothetical protein
VLGHGLSFHLGHLDEPSKLKHYWNLTNTGMKQTLTLAIGANGLVLG